MFLRLTFCFIFLFNYLMVAQIAVTNAPPFNTAENIVNDLLLGDDLETSNWSWQNGSSNIGYFDGFSANIGFEEGVIMCTGGIDFVTTGAGAGPGMSGDADLEEALSALGMSGFSVNNVTILEFDFVANSESMAFNYVFGSMEYTSYTCSSFNDVFGFFLSGPGITGPYSNNGVNIALVPDPDNPGSYTDTPVAVNTVNNGEMTNDPDCNDLDPNFEDYNIFWVDNDYSGAGWQGVNEPPDPEFTVEGLTGFTVPLTAEYNGLTCGETYHIKLAIADCADGVLNSAVFLEANSFVSPSVLVNPISNINGPELFGDSLAIYEGCAAAQLEFNAAGNSEYDIILEVLFEGDVEYGVDFDITYNGGNALDACINNDGEVSQCITIPVGQELMYLDIQAFYDNDNENFEDLEIVINAITGLCQQAELAVSEITFNLYDQIPIVVDPGAPSIIECFGDEVTLEPTLISGGYIGDSNDYTYEWYDQDGNQVGAASSLIVNSSADSEYQLIVYDDCADQEIVTDFEVEVIEYNAIEMGYPAYFACDEDIVTLIPNISGGSGDYSYVWPDSPTPCDCESFNFEFELENGDSQLVDFQIIDNCSDETYEFSIPVELAVTPSPVVDILVIGSQFCPNDEITLNAEVDGESTYTYEWLNLDADEYYVNNLATVSPVENTTYDVIIIDECNDNETIFSIDIEAPFYDPPTFSLFDLAGCVGQELELSVEDLFAEGVQDPTDISQYSFLWSTGDDSPSINVVVQEDPETYFVQISDLCGNMSESVSATVTASIPPPPAFTFEQVEDGVQFNQLTQDLFTNFDWDFGDGNNSIEYEPLHMFDAEGDYYVTLVASDDLGCSNSYTALVNIYASLFFYSPDVFSPNGDGINDSFNVSIVGHDSFELFIYDRWGNQLFSTTDTEEGWDGTYPNGKEVPQDVYMYKVFMSNPGTGEKMEKGRVSIIK
jgi:gliding motility-associated-like protein